MWIERTAFILAFISGTACAIFTLDILVWTFGVSVPFAPLESLLRLGIWLIAFALSLCLPYLSERWVKPKAEDVQ